MINRRLIRIKVFKTLYAYMNSGNTSIDSARRELLASCESTRNLYCFILNSLPAVRKLQAGIIDAKRCKYNPTEEELNPNYRFVQNRFILALEQDEEFNKFCNDKGLLWPNEESGADNVFISRLSKSITSSDYYRDYMSSSEDSLDLDCSLVADILQNEFEENDLFARIIEEMSFFWIDDAGFALGQAIKDVGRYAKKQKFQVPEVFRPDRNGKTSADREFAVELLQSSFSHYKEYSEVIAANVDNWDSDRIVSTDLTLIVMGIAEATEFQDIPVKVTIDEYVDISKYYSTQTSWIFVNGLLDKIIQKKINSGEIKKVME